MEHRVFSRPCVARTAGLSVRILEDLSLDEQGLETWDRLEQKRFGWALGERLDGKSNLEGFSTRTGWEVVEEIAEANLVKGME
jgi:hypothetical protein